MIALLGEGDAIAILIIIILWCILIFFVSVGIGRQIGRRNRRR